MARGDTEQGYDAGFIGTLFERFHRRQISDADAAGLAGMLGPIETLAEQAAGGLGFDDEPADFLRVMAEQRRAGDPS